jgi:hypothetical protein
MLRGRIPCTWDQNFVEQINFEYHPRNTLGVDPDQLDLLDPKNMDRYDIGRWTARDLDKKGFEFIDEHFRWLKNKHFQINLFKPGVVGPLHVDHYSYYNDLYNVTDDNEIIRVILFLQDWKSGHYFEVENIGIVNWSAGDWVGFDLPTPHALANIGSKNRYTLQITGTKI